MTLHLMWACETCGDWISTGTDSCSCVAKGLKSSLRAYDDKFRAITPGKPAHPLSKL